MGRVEQFGAALAPRWLIHRAGQARAKARTMAAARAYGPLVCELLPDAIDHDLLVANDDAVVIRVKMADGSENILKLATTPVADAHLQAEIASLQELASMDELGDWRRKISSVQAHGSHATGTWFTQSVMPGVPDHATGLNPEQLVTRAATALKPVHMATGVSLLADEAVLDLVVSQPVDLITQWRPALASELRLIDGECRQRMASLDVALARQHGDFAPSNVLWDQARRTVTGIVDWTFSAEPLPPEIDYVHYALSLLAAQKRQEYGHVVEAALQAEPGPLLAVLERANDAGPNDFDIRTVVTLAWLQHIAFGLNKSVGLRTNPIWLTRNIDAVVAALGRN